MPEPIFTSKMSQALQEKVAVRGGGGKTLTKKEWEEIAAEINAENASANLEWNQVKEKAKKLKRKAKAEVEAEISGHAPICFP